MPKIDETVANKKGDEQRVYNGYAVLTINDAPCRLSLMSKVLDLFDEYDAKYTFMIISNYAHRPDMIRVLQSGHEFANHGINDEPMDKLSIESFTKAVEEALAGIGGDDDETKREGVKWFRTPQSRYTKNMEKVLESKGMRNVMWSDSDTVQTIPGRSNVPFRIRFGSCSSSRNTDNGRSVARSATSLHCNRATCIIYEQ